MITPPYLTQGDTVAIVAPARKVSPSEIEPAIRILQGWGLKVITGQHLFGDQDQYSGSDEHRAEDLQTMLDHPGVKAIFAARGGYGTVRIIDRLNFDAFCQRPKWIVGFSDITVLHSHIHTQLGIETIHAAMPLTFPVDNQDHITLQSLKNALFGEDLSYTLSVSPLSRQGSCEGQLVGGNLSILYAMNATASDLDTTGKILFLEDLDEYLYHIDRMMLNLRRSGKLSSLAGLLIGGMTRMNDNSVPFGKTAEEIIRDAVEGFDYPVCIGFPAGHMDDNRALILGRKLFMSVTDEGVRLEFSSRPQDGKPVRLLSRILKPALLLLAFFVFIYLLYFLLIPLLR